MRYVLFFLCLCPLLWAKPICEISSIQDQYHIESCTQYYQGDLNPIQDQSLWMNSSHFKLKNYSSQNYWQKIELYNSLNDSTPLIWKEYLAKDLLVQFYLYENGKLIKTCSSGTSIAPKDRCLSLRYPSISLKIPPHTNLILYVEKQSSNPLKSRPTLHSPQGFEEVYMEGLFVGYHYFGIALGVLAINLLMFWIIRERIFASYVIFHFSLVLTTLIITGFAEIYLGYLNWAKYLPLVMLFTVWAYLVFCIHYFQISLQKYGKWILFIALWPLLQSTIHYFNPNLPAFDDQSFFFTVLVVLLLTFLLKGKDSKRKLFFVIAWSGYMVLLSCYILFIAQVLPNHVFFKYGAYEAHIWEMIWFTVGFAKLTVARIKNAQEISDELKSEKELILTRFSHELRTPLMGILGAVESKNMNNNEESQLIEISAHKLLAHVNNVIHYMDYTQDKTIQIQSTWCDLSSYAKSWTKELELRYKDKEIKIQNLIQDLDSIELSLDIRLFSQCVLALLDNACKFSTEKIIVFQLSYMDSQLCVQIKNNGPIFNELQLDRYTQGFQKGESFLRQKYGGLGLGLSLVYHIQQIFPFKFQRLEYPHGAHLLLEWRAESREKIIEIPQESKPTKILIVDDNLINRKVLNKLVSEYPIESELAIDGLDAYKKWRKGKANLIFMDLQMPKMDGLESTRWIRKMEAKLNLPRAYIIAISAHISPSAEEECLDAGIDEVCAKPVSKIQIKNWLKAFD